MTNFEANMADISESRALNMYLITLDYLNRSKAGTETGIQKSLVNPKVIEKFISEGKCEVRYENGFYFVKKANKK